MAINQVTSRDINVAVQLGNAAVSVTAEGVSWNPTIARDMQDRAMGMLREILVEAMNFGVPMVVESGMFVDSSETDDDEEGEDGE